MPRLPDCASCQLHNLQTVQVASCTICKLCTTSSSHWTCGCVRLLQIAREEFDVCQKLARLGHPEFYDTPRRSEVQTVGEADGKHYVSIVWEDL